MTSADDFERYEGMLVTFPQELTVTELFQLGRFGQVTVSSGGRLQQPTNVVAPGPRPTPSRRGTTSTGSSSTTRRRPRTPTRSSGVVAAGR